jgi:hypothetical protein
MTDTTTFPHGVEILTWLDDCSRYALHVSAHPRITAPIVLASFRQAVAAHGIPAATLTDNGMVFTTRFAGGRGGRASLEHELRRLHITQKNSRPGHPTTCGKVERFQQTLKKWLRAQPAQPASLADLQTLLEEFADAYNARGPHRSLPRQATPAAIYTTLPKALPGPSRDPDTHDRVRHDIVDQSGVVTLRHAGKLHHIGIGRTHTRTHVILLIQDLHVRVVNSITSELPRESTPTPKRDHRLADEWTALGQLARVRWRCHDSRASMGPSPEGTSAIWSRRVRGRRGLSHVWRHRRRR